MPQGGIYYGKGRKGWERQKDPGPVSGNADWLFARDAIGITSKGCRLQQVIIEKDSNKECLRHRFT